MARGRLLAGLAFVIASISTAAPSRTIGAAELDAEARAGMAATGARGLAVAVIENGKVVHAKSWGVRNAAAEPLTTDTIMYGASLTKTLFAYMVMQLAEEGRIDLDRSIEAYLPRPLPDYAAEERKYAPWHHLKGDERWRKLTPRILLTHSPGFANFAFVEPDGKLRFHFDPGARYAYSGEGLILLQFVLERGLGFDVGAEMQRRVFDRFGMSNTSMMWRPDFAANLADGWDLQGKVEPHDERSKVRAAGSMDTTISDIARFAAGAMRREGLSAAGWKQLLRPHLAITTATQFPTLQPELPPERRRKDLAAGLGLVVFKGPQGRGFFKGGHNDTTGNMMVCLERGRRCAVMLANDVRAEAAFPRLVQAILGETGAPWDWEYGEAIAPKPRP
jgi:CubicO group peptidase (beta-lactamase class C family)